MQTVVIPGNDRILLHWQFVDFAPTVSEVVAGPVSALLMDLHRFLRDVDCGTAGDAAEISQRVLHLTEWIDKVIPDPEPSPSKRLRG